MKSLAIPDELHALIKEESYTEKREIRAIVAAAFQKYFGERFPDSLRDLLPPEGKRR